MNLTVFGMRQKKAKTGMIKLPDYKEAGIACLLFFCYTKA